MNSLEILIAQSVSLVCGLGALSYYLFSRFYFSYLKKIKNKENELIQRLQEFEHDLHQTQKIWEEMRLQTVQDFQTLRQEWESHFKEQAEKLEENRQRFLLHQKQYDSVVEHISKQTLFFQNLDKKYQSMTSEISKKLQDISRSHKIPEADKKYEGALSYLEKDPDALSLKKALGFTDDEIEYLKYRKV